MPVSTQHPRVSFHYNDRIGFVLANRTGLKSFIALLISKERKRLDSLRYVFCSDDFLLEINKQYLEHDFYTDIISFDLSDRKSIINGEIYISIDRVKENALDFKTSFKQELHRVIFHGALHLCGYGDKTTTQIKEMRELEDKYLSLYFYSSTWNSGNSFIKPVPRGTKAR